MEHPFFFFFSFPFFSQKGYGMEDGTFFGVYDEHGGNGHKVSKIVSSRLSSLILDQKNVLEKIDAIENG